jgi:seryl-tRNA synthetase
MHDPRVLLQDPAGLSRRGYTLDRERLADLVLRKRETGRTVDELRTQARTLNRGDGRSDDNRRRGQELRQRLRQAEQDHRAVDEEMTELLLRIPNLPAPDTPDGFDEKSAVEVRHHDAGRRWDFEPRHHADLGESTGLLDLARAGKLSGARFSVARGAGAALERALATFFLDMHVRENGYVEYSVPSLVTRETMTATGQLPKFAEDLFVTTAGDRELFLIPTAEVPLTNLFAGAVLDARELPLALTAHTHCFRSEAGSYGRDTRGLTRLHEFSKVELVRICHPDESRSQLELMTSHAEMCLQRLGLTYRVVMLAAGDLGFSAAATYDIEVWLPGQQAFREISSCSDCGTFQARRAGIRVRGRAGKQFCATLNGSALPIGRTLMAIMEQYQRADGGIDVPAALWPYTGFTTIGPDGYHRRTESA